MSKGQDNQDPKIEGSAGSEREPKKLHRRELLRIGAIAAGAAVPVVMTLAPRRARAEGSWQCAPGNQGAQGSWCQGSSTGKKPSWGGDNWRQTARDQKGNGAYDARQNNGGFVFPGSHEWRLRREAEATQRRRERGEFSRFGSNDE